MPRERRTRIGAHQPSAKLSKRQFAVQETALEAVEIGAAEEALSGNDVLDSLSTPPAVMSKKVKQQLKHDAFVGRIESSSTPYSKAQKRRFNRKQRGQIGGGLGSIEAVISALEGEELPAPRTTQSGAVTSHQKTAARTALIGEGKGVPLTKAQRKHALEMERLRHPLILTNPQYSTNPFETIRTHARNTLEKRVAAG